MTRVVNLAYNQLNGSIPASFNSSGPLRLVSAQNMAKLEHAQLDCATRVRSCQNQDQQELAGLLSCCTKFCYLEWHHV